MSQDGSNVEYINIVFYQLSGKSMPQSMGRKFERNFPLNLVKHRPQISLRKSKIIFRWKEIERILKFFFQDHTIIRKNRNQLSGYRNHSAFSTFPITDGKSLIVRIKVFWFEIQKFFSTDPRIKEDLENSKISKPEKTMKIESMRESISESGDIILVY